MIELFQIRYIFIIHMSERGIKMECESMLTKRFFVLLLMLAMLVTLIFCFSGSAEAATQKDSINKVINWLNLYQDEAGSWGIAEGYESDVLDTIIVINSIVGEKYVETDILRRAVSYIISTQNGFMVIKL
jgi:prenyltransferase beta subunit